MIANTPVLLPKSGKTILVTISAGIAGLGDADGHGEQVVSLAAAGLFRAKAGGRNRIVTIWEIGGRGNSQDLKLFAVPVFSRNP